MKKKVLFHSCFSRNKTGFSRNARAILTYLFKTGKYDLVEFGTGLQWSAPETKFVPWKCRGVLPDSQAELENLMRGDQGMARATGYGAALIDRIVHEEKPDIIFSVEDFWGINYMIDKPYYDKIPVVLWTTLDSLPLLPEAVEKAPKIPYYYMWSEFAEKEMHRLGHTHVRTLHGAIDAEEFYPLKAIDRSELRMKHELHDKFVIGFVFRNQLRKLVPNLFEGYALWKRQNPEVKNTALLLHTHFSEPRGWDIPRLRDQYGIAESEVLTTYICRQCSAYQVKAYTGQEKDCPYCGAQRAQITTNTGFGVTESQLNEVYNLMDVYIHPFTSGGQEMPIQEAKLAGLITLVTDYSCGEDMCVPEAGSLPLDWAKYTELETQFTKASTRPDSIAKQLNKVYNMSREDRLKIGKRARGWVLENYATNVIGKQIEDIIDNAPKATFDFSAPSYVPKNPNFPMPEIPDELIWIKTLYKNILNMDEPDDSEGVKHWQNALKNNVPRKHVYDYFVKVALEENQKNIKIEFGKILGDEPAEKRLLFCMPQSAGDVFIATALLKSLRETYPDKVIYFATNPQYFPLVESSPYIDRVLEWQPFMDDLLAMEGCGPNKGYFDIVFLPHVATQRFLSYLHNGHDKLAIDVRV